MPIRWTEEQLAEYQRRQGQPANYQPPETITDQPKRPKYGNRKVVINGYMFDSKSEGDRYCELWLLQKGGVISGLELQPEFVLRDGYTKPDGKKVRPIKYVADFAYTEDGREVVEDVKSVATEKNAVFRLKKKMFEERHPDKVFRVVGAND